MEKYILSSSKLIVYLEYWFLSVFLEKFPHFLFRKVICNRDWVGFNVLECSCICVHVFKVHSTEKKEILPQLFYVLWMNFNWFNIWLLEFYKFNWQYLQSWLILRIVSFEVDESVKGLFTLGCGTVKSFKNCSSSR